MTQSPEVFSAIRWTGETLLLLDQRVLPAEEKWLECTKLDEVIAAIKQMVVRGAPAIGIAAAYGAVLMLPTEDGETRPHHTTNAVEMKEALARLEQARPTAVNLMWAVRRIRECVRTHWSDNDNDNRPTLVALRQQLETLAEEIHADDIAANRAMARLALPYFQAETIRPVAVLTHCNTGALATGGLGTALGVITHAYHEGFVHHVYADETRPWLQGSRLTAWELQREGVRVSINADGAAAWLMRERQVKWVIVGADRIAENGDVANKIGTYGLAVLARHHGCKFMVVAPSSTVDMACQRGADIEIEMRTGTELTSIGGQLIAPRGCATVNPVFDVTPADLIDVIVTEKGVVESPSRARMRDLFAQQ